MTGYNHGLTGGAIGYLLPLPIALPLALTSHFVLDALPHYGIDHRRRDHSWFWKAFGTADALLTLAVLLYAIGSRHYAMAICGVVAVMPDFIWVARILRRRSFDLSQNHNWFTRFHVAIQRYERPWGIWVELPVAGLLSYLVFFKFWS